MWFNSTKDKDGRDTMKIILIRHGETIANTLFNTNERILIGALNTPITYLNENGIKQANQAKNKLKDIEIDEIYCSDLYRAKQTASIIFGEKEMHYTSELRERCLGSDEGKKASEVFKEPTAWNYHVNSETDSLENCLNKKVIDGESYQDVLNRCQHFLKSFDFEEDKTIAIVAHFHFIRCMSYVLLNKKPDLDLFHHHIPNATPITFEYIKNQFHYISE